MSSSSVEKMLQMSDKRYAAMRLRSECPKCGSEQVQLKSWMINTTWKCRKCSHNFGETAK